MSESHAFEYIVPKAVETAAVTGMHVNAHTNNPERYILVLSEWHIN